MDALACIEIMISIVLYGLGTCPSWIAHLAGCKFDDQTWDKPEERRAAIELMAEALGKTYNEADTIAKAFAHGDYGL